MDTTTDTTMADEFYERYRHLSHQELYRMLHNGSVSQVAKVADTWASVADTLAAMSAALRRDLDRLQPDWTGRGSREFHYRVDIVARYAQTLADEAAAIRGGLNAMSSSLHEAQRRAETPELAFTRESTIPSDGVLGSELGRVLPVDQQASAHERMVQVVAQLAADYGVADHGNWPVALPDAPLDLPAAGQAAAPVTSVLGPEAGGTTLAAASSLVPAARAAVQAGEIPATASGAIPGAIPGTIAAGVGATARVETLRGSHTPTHAIGLDDPAGTAARQGPAGAAATSNPASNPASAPAAATAPGAAAPMAPMGLGPAGAMPMGVSADAVAWRSADNMDWAEDDSETPPGVLGD